ncbi:MAG: thioredoxin domain-containing protein [Burkholderiaceae bacterium]|nr:thioredoxin domain-containing protein [Burkholderiaceae bacterium]
MENRASGPEPKFTNRLANETSPYLLQHAHNPVDWYPWGAEAFARARAEDKPILLSVGYATCHWCHVMERESFEDETVAAILRAGFIAIKVDREELPDVDQVYMSALQALTGQGGWPMNMFLTPQLAPFHGGSYFPPEPRHGLPGFAELLDAISDAWRNRRADLEHHASELLEHVRKGSAAPRRAAADGLHDRAIAGIARNFDVQYGGFGSAPKFPQPPLLQYLLARASAGTLEAGHEDAVASLPAGDAARTMLVATLRQMSAGGIYDHVGGGFARYSTDRRWHVPHFEKMLYDNAQLVRLYVGAWRLTGDERLRFVAEDTLAYLEREMHPAASRAAFCCAQDADAEGVEGRFHCWTEAQLEDVLGADAPAAAQLYGVTTRGNWEHGLSVLERRTPEKVRAQLGLDVAQWVQWERCVRERLLAARSQRVWPITDDKVLADWNGMMLHALAEAGRLLARPILVERARQLAEFLLGEMMPDGRLSHAWRAGRRRKEGYLSDYAQVGLGLVELHAATAETGWLERAFGLTEAMIARFHVAGEGFFEGEAGDLPVRARDAFDGAVPSGIGAACELLVRLGGIYGRDDWLELARAALADAGAIMEAAPAAVPAMLLAHLLAEAGAQLALPFERSAPGEGSGGVAGARREFMPLVTIAAGAPGELPLLTGRDPGKAYLCQHGRCQLPAASLEELRGQIDRLTENL